MNEQSAIKVIVYLSGNTFSKQFYCTKEFKTLGKDHYFYMNSFRAYPSLIWTNLASFELKKQISELKQLCSKIFCGIFVQFLAHLKHYLMGFLKACIKPSTILTWCFIQFTHNIPMHTIVQLRIFCTPSFFTDQFGSCGFERLSILKTYACSYLSWGPTLK